MTKLSISRYIFCRFPGLFRSNRILKHKSLSGFVRFLGVLGNGHLIVATSSGISFEFTDLLTEKRSILQNKLLEKSYLSNSFTITCSDILSAVKMSNFLPDSSHCTLHLSPPCEKTRSCAGILDARLTFAAIQRPSGNGISVV
jgi:hypothetical protein